MHAHHHHSPSIEHFRVEAHHQVRATKDHSPTVEYPPLMAYSLHSDHNLEYVDQHDSPLPSDLGSASTSQVCLIRAIVPLNYHRCTIYWLELSTCCSFYPTEY